LLATQVAPRVLRSAIILVGVTALILMYPYILDLAIDRPPPLCPHEGGSVNLPGGGVLICEPLEGVPGPRDLLEVLF
jgi:hypothetical protein